MKNKERIKIISYLALYVALYVVLKYVGNLIPILQMPNGGSIELELVAIFIASYHLGWKPGLCVAILSWLITIVLGFPMYFAQPVQVLLDYVLPLAVCGIASLLWPFKKMNKILSVLLAVCLGILSAVSVYESYLQTTLSLVFGCLVGIAMAIVCYWYLKNNKSLGIIIAMVLKYAFQVLSGVYFWMPEGEAAGSAYAWTFSLGYNLWYNVVTLVVCLVIVPLLIESLKKAHISFAKG